MILGLIVLAAWVLVAMVISTYTGAILLSMVLNGTSLDGGMLVFAVCFLLFGAILSWGFVVMCYSALRKDKIL
jgi:uncharacterized PurR-regulated membrane protein YhhQ (DUF165 family)